MTAFMWDQTALMREVSGAVWTDAGRDNTG